MNNFNIFDLYNNTEEELKEKFLDNIDSRLEVKNKYRKVVYDYSWLEKMEETMRYLDNIMRNPKKFIVNEEEVVKIEKARKVTVDSIKHLTQHTSYIQKFDQETGEVKPSKILNINKEENFDMYENRFIYTLLINMKMFISKVSGDCINGSSLKRDRNIRYNATTKIGTEKVDVHIDLSAINDQKLSSSSKGASSISQRIEKITLQLADFMNTDFIKDLDRAHVALVRSPIKKTNVILKNPNFQKAVELWTFLESYDFNNVQEENINDEYEDTQDFRSNMNDSFLLDYIILDNILDSNKTQENTYEINRYYINKIIKDFIDNNIEYDEKMFIKLLKDEFKEIRKAKEIKLNRIRSIYQKDINDYNKIIQNSIKILGKWNEYSKKNKKNIQ